MRGKQQYSINLKIVPICFLFLFFLFLIMRTCFSYPKEITTLDSSILPTNSSDVHEEQLPTDCPTVPLLPTCNKIPSSLAHSLVHYATLNITPQQTINEISVSLKVLEKKSPCNFLVFGLGHDSLMWTSLNHGGRTVFLEEDKSWIEQIQRQVPSLESYHVVYDTKLTQAEELQMRCMILSGI